MCRPGGGAHPPEEVLWTYLPTASQPADKPRREPESGHVSQTLAGGVKSKTGSGGKEKALKCLWTDLFGYLTESSNILYLLQFSGQVQLFSQFRL